MLKKIKEQLHRIFFPSYEEIIDNLVNSKQEWMDNYDELKEVSQKKIDINPSMSDLMRDNLKLMTIDFIHQEKGIPEDFLKTATKEQRKTYISQLYQIQQFEVWQVMIDNLINIQGNYTIRVAETDMEVFAGRMLIGGVTLIKDKVKDAYDEHLERSGPKEEFDPTDNSTEGISILSDGEDINS